MNYVSKIYNLTNDEETKEMEKEKKRLSKKYLHVKLAHVGKYQFRIICSMF